MAESWIDVDWSADRPDPDQIAASLRALRYAPVPVGGEHTRRLLDELRSAYSNGGALLAGFQVEDDDHIARWFTSRNRFAEYRFFEHLLLSEAVASALPDLVENARVTPGLPSFEESFAGAFGLDGWLARILTAGGAYDRFGGTAAEAKALALSATDELVGGRYDEFHVYVAYEAWSDWFRDVAWDSTHVIVDCGTRRVYVLALTDTD